MFVSVGKLEDLLLKKQLIKCFCWAGRALTAAKSFYNSLKVRRLIVRPSISIKVVARNYFGHLVKLDTHLSDEGLCHFHKKDNSLTLLNKGSPPEKKNVFFWALPKFPPPPPPSPQFGQLVPLCFDVKNDVLARITKQSKDDYDNDVSDNCDHNFGTFDDWC